MFKYKLGDLVIRVQTNDPSPSGREFRVINNLKWDLQESAPFNIVGIIIKLFDKSELWKVDLDEEESKSYDIPTDDYNGYLWLCSKDGKVYQIYEYECKKVVNE